MRIGGPITSAITNSKNVIGDPFVFVLRLAEPENGGETKRTRIWPRLASRRGPKRAQMAIAHSMLIAIYHMLRDGAHFVDLGPEHWDSRHRASVAQRSIRRLAMSAVKTARRTAAKS